MPTTIIGFDNKIGMMKNQIKMKYLEQKQDYLSWASCKIADIVVMPFGL